MVRIYSVVKNIDFNSLPRILDTIGWYGGPHLYNSAFLSLLRKTDHFRGRCLCSSSGFSSSVSLASGKIGLIDGLALLDHIKTPGLVYTDSLQWQDNIPGSVNGVSRTKRPPGFESYDQNLIRFVD